MIFCFINRLFGEVTHLEIVLGLIPLQEFESLSLRHEKHGFFRAFCVFQGKTTSGKAALLRAGRAPAARTDKGR